MSFFGALVTLSNLARPKPCTPTLHSWRRSMCRSCEKCDRCDGAHPTAECPHFRRQRGEHQDAQRMPLAEQPPPTTSAAAITSRGSLEPQPPDGSCLYHSIGFGLRHLRLAAPAARTMRVTLAAWARNHPRTRVAGQSIRAWLSWEMDGAESLEKYVERQAVGGWGGVIEIIAASREYDVTIAAWIPVPGKPQLFKRTVRQTSDRMTYMHQAPCMYTFAPTLGGL